MSCDVGEVTESLENELTVDQQGNYFFPLGLNFKQHDFMSYSLLLVQII